jgi:hypothetical protein
VQTTDVYLPIADKDASITSDVGEPLAVTLIGGRVESERINLR